MIQKILFFSEFYFFFLHILIKFFPLYHEENMKTVSYKDKLNFFINKKIRIHTKHNAWMEGKLCGFDQFMNLSLKDLVIISENKRQKLGLSLLRGSVILSIQPLE